MKHSLVFIAFLLLLNLSNCVEPTDTTTTTNKVYESCCGVEPVEFTFGDAYMFVPNVFTPNGDGINDYFVPAVNDDVLAFDAYLIYTAVGDTLLFDRNGFSYQNIPSWAWDGNRKDGTPYIGPFKYEFVVFLKNNIIYTVKGSACRVACGPDASFFTGKTTCFYPIQADTSGRLNKSFPSQELDCFK